MKKFISFLILATLFFTACTVNSKNLGMTFEDFREQYYSKCVANQLQNYSPYKAVVKKNEKGYTCDFNNGVVMMVEVDKQTGFITEVSVAAQPIKTKSKSETVKLLLDQSTVYSLAAMVFSPKMENQIWREDVMKKLFQNTNGNSVVSDNLNCKSLYINETIILVAEHK